MTLLASIEIPDERIVHVVEVDERHTPLGWASWVQVGTFTQGPLSWPEIQQVFNEALPDRWAVQVHPPKERVLDEADIYHLWVFDDLSCLDIVDDPHAGTLATEVTR